MCDTKRKSDATEFAEMLHKTPTLVRYGVRCGKPSCRCNAGKLHGPYSFLYWRDEHGCQRRRYIRKADIKHVENVIHERKRIEREARLVAASAQKELLLMRRWLDSLEWRGTS